MGIALYHIRELCGLLRANKLPLDVGNGSGQPFYREEACGSSLTGQTSGVG
jgi:hypothetical protein